MYSHFLCKLTRVYNYRRWSCHQLLQPSAGSGEEGDVGTPNKVPQTVRYSLVLVMLFVQGADTAADHGLVHWSHHFIQYGEKAYPGSQGWRRLTHNQRYKWKWWKFDGIILKILVVIADHPLQVKFSQTISTTIVLRISHLVWNWSLCQILSRRGS